MAADEAARTTARAGARRASANGLGAVELAARAEPNIVSTILRTADEQDAVCVVVGSRGRSKLRSALLGSVSNAIVHQCRRPVLVVHNGDLEHNGDADA